MERKVMAAAILLVMLSVSPFIVVASASTHQNPLGTNQSLQTQHERNASFRQLSGNETENHNERNITIQPHSANETEVESEHEDHLAIHFATDAGISLKLEYNSHAGNTSAEFELQVTFKSLVELAGNATVKTIDLTKVHYSSPQTNATSSGGINGYRIESHATGTTYTFQIVAFVYGNATIVNGTSLSSKEVKINILIENFPYAQTNSSLGLVVEASSQAEIHDAHSPGGEDDVEVGTTVTRGFFSWSSSALIDNVNRSVSSVVSKEAEDHLITLVYPHGTKIVHDPVLGVGPVPVSTGLFGSIALYIAFGAAILAVALVFAVRRARPRIQNSVSK